MRFAAKKRATSDENRPLRLRCENSSPPWTYSSRRYKFRSSWNVQNLDVWAGFSGGCGKLERKSAQVDDERVRDLRERAALRVEVLNLP